MQATKLREKRSLKHFCSFNLFPHIPQFQFKHMYVSVLNFETQQEMLASYTCINYVCLLFYKKGGKRLFIEAMDIQICP